MVMLWPSMPMLILMFLNNSTKGVAHMKFEKTYIEVIKITVDDIITTSGCTNPSGAFFPLED